MKNILYQKLGKSYLTYEGLSRVVKDTEIVFNNRPLQYVEDEEGFRVLTPNRIIHGRDIYQLEEIEEPYAPSKMEKRIRKAKEMIWERRLTEYVRALRERHDVTKVKPYHPEIGEVVLVVGESKNRYQWKHGLVRELLRRKDKEVRGVGMVVKDKVWERPIQLVFPLEIKSTLPAEELNRRIRVASRKDQVEAPVKRPSRVVKETGAAKSNRLLADM